MQWKRPLWREDRYFVTWNSHLDKLECESYLFLCHAMEKTVVERGSLLCDMEFTSRQAWMWIISISMSCNGKGRCGERIATLWHGIHISTSLNVNRIYFYVMQWKRPLWREDRYFVTWNSHLDKLECESYLFLCHAMEKTVVERGSLLCDMEFTSRQAWMWIISISMSCNEKGHCGERIATLWHGIHISTSLNVNHIYFYVMQWKRPLWREDRYFVTWNSHLDKLECESYLFLCHAMEKTVVERGSLLCDMEFTSRQAWMWIISISMSCNGKDRCGERIATLWHGIHISTSLNVNHIYFYVMQWKRPLWREDRYFVTLNSHLDKLECESYLFLCHAMKKAVVERGSLLCDIEFTSRQAWMWIISISMSCNGKGRCGERIATLWHGIHISTSLNVNHIYFYVMQWKRPLWREDRYFVTLNSHLDKLECESYLFLCHAMKKAVVERGSLLCDMEFTSRQAWMWIISIPDTFDHFFCSWQVNYLSLLYVWYVNSGVYEWFTVQITSVNEHNNINSNNNYNSNGNDDERDINITRYFFLAV